jgi:hypothetical protein
MPGLTSSRRTVGEREHQDAVDVIEVADTKRRAIPPPPSW